MFMLKDIMDVVSGKRKPYEGGACFGTQDPSRLRPAWRTPVVPSNKGKKKDGQKTVMIDLEPIRKQARGE